MRVCSVFLEGDKIDCLVGFYDDVGQFVIAGRLGRKHDGLLIFGPALISNHFSKFIISYS